MFLNTINSSDVRPGDHLYRYRWFGKQHGIAVRYPQLASIFVITSYKNTLSLVTLNEFKGQSSLRRVTYEQGSSCIRKMKFSHSRPPEEIIQNAFLLLEWIKTSPDRVRALFANDLSQFARRCCTTVHEQWCNFFYSTQGLISSNRHLNNKQTSRKNNAFNAALMCGMPFRRALHIGTEGFWVDRHDENDSVVGLWSSLESTLNGINVLPALIELSSDDQLLLI